MCLAISFGGLSFTAGAGPTVRENAGASGFQMLEEPVTPRMIAMGSAGTATPGAGFAYYNPALPFLQPRPSVTVEYGQHGAADLHYANFETTWRIKDFFTGLSVHSQSVEIIPTSINGANYSTPGSWQTTALSIDAGYAFGPAAVALSFNGVQDRIFDDAAYALTLSGGAIWAPIPDKLSLGIAAFHWGRTTSYLDTNEHFGYNVQLPQTGRVGASWHDRIKSVEYRGAVDVVYRRTDGRFMVPMGIEVWPVDALAVRMGTRLFHDTEHFTLGCGLRLDPLTVDMSFAFPKYAEDTELKWLLGVTYALKKQPALPSVKKAPESSQPIAVPVPLAPVSKPATPVVIDTAAATGSAATVPPDTLQKQGASVTPATIQPDTAAAGQSILPAADCSSVTAVPSLPTAPAPASAPQPPVSGAADSAGTVQNPPQSPIPARPEDAR
jgi:hypothetical protein